MIYFLDTSALLKRYVEEEGSTYIRQLLTRPDLSFHQSFLTPLDMTSALYRRHRAGFLSNPELIQILNAYTAHTQDRYATILHSDKLMNLAATLIACHPLRSLEAIQLAAALTLQSTFPPNASPFTFVSADDRLLAIAQLENLLTDNPNAHP
jgi:predicted nucleic acid-binding protein